MSPSEPYVHLSMHTALPLNLHQINIRCKRIVFTIVFTYILPQPQPQPLPQPQEESHE